MAGSIEKGYRNWSQGGMHDFRDSEGAGLLWTLPPTMQFGFTSLTDSVLQ
jgi:hypothetical protein